ncbi:MAG: CBS domain-containing protein [Euryarchaeota archaeon]|nr:CBS domain-containing protein [Euryarchaeota archaeon]
MENEEFKPKVGDYMSKDVITVTPETTVKEIANLIISTGHDGFPVVENGKIIGIVTSRDLILQISNKKAKDIMSTNVVITYPNVNIIDVARVMFRMGFQRLPVVDEDYRLVGLITNMDVIRSTIERANPMRVKRVKESIERIHGVKVDVQLNKVKINDLRPTQSVIYTDELEGRIYEIRKGLAEPLIVIKTGGRTVLVDGHHRAIAAQRLGVEETEAYILTLSKDVILGLEKTAEKEGLNTLADIKIVDEIPHKLIDIISTRRRG